MRRSTKKLAASGGYDPGMARQRIEEWKAREVQSAECRVQSGTNGRNGTNGTSPRPSPQSGEGAAVPLNNVGVAFPQTPAQPAGAAPASPKSGAPGGAPAATADFDPEVGF
jgi:hypothetical protein